MLRLLCLLQFVVDESGVCGRTDDSGVCGRVDKFVVFVAGLLCRLGFGSCCRKRGVVSARLEC